MRVGAVNDLHDSLCAKETVSNAQYFRLKTTHSANQSIIFEAGKNAPMGIAVDTPKRGKPAYSPPPPPSALSVVVPHSDRFRSSSDRAIVATRSAPPRPPASIGLLHVRACVRDWVCRAFPLSAVLPPSPRRLMPRSSEPGLRPSPARPIP